MQVRKLAKDIGSRLTGMFSSATENNLIKHVKSVQVIESKMGKEEPLVLPKKKRKRRTMHKWRKRKR